MLRRCFLEPSSRRRLTTQIPAFLSARQGLSTVPEQKPVLAGGQPERRSSFPKLVVASVAVGAAATVAYRYGYLDQILGKDKLGVPEKAEISDNLEAKDFPPLGEKAVSETSNVSPSAETRVDVHSDAPSPEPVSQTQAEDVPVVEDKSDVTVAEDTATVVKQDVLHESIKTPQGESLSTESSEASQPVTAQASEEQGMESLPPQHHIPEDKPAESSMKDSEEPSSSLLDAYDLKDNVDESAVAELLPLEKEAFVSATEENDGYISKDGELIFGFLKAIHAAEKRQAEIDARVLAEEKKALKDKYEKELKDAIAREFMRAEEAAILDKELKRERAKAIAAIKSLQEKAEETLRMELENKDNELEMKLQKVEELGKAEVAAKIASEKAAQIEKIAEANLNINALCMAFYARSEEARNSHSAHKFALGALALDDALSKGVPIQAEIEALQAYLEGNDREPILDLVLESLPEETKSHGTYTVLQLNQKFDGLKGTLRHLSILPAGGRGILAHSLAHIASWLRVKEVNGSGEGIESVISRVESYLSEGKLVEAADALEEGVQGSQAAEIVRVWVTQARNRAIAEQALSLLQSYATSVSLS